MKIALAVCALVAAFVTVWRYCFREDPLELDQKTKERFQAMGAMDVPEPTGSRRRDAIDGPPSDFTRPWKASS